MAEERVAQKPAGGMLGMRPRRMTGLMGPKEKVKDSKSTLKRLWSYLALQKVKLAAVFLLVLASSLFNLSGPYLIGKAIDSMIGGKAGVDFQRLFTITITMLIVYGLGALATWLQTYMMVGVAQSTVRELRKDLFEKLQTLSVRFFDRQPHGELMSRLTNDVDNVNNTLSQSTTQIFSSIITVTGSLGMMLWLSPVLTVLSLISLPLGMMLTRKVAETTRSYFSSQQKELGELNGYIEEIISGQKVVKSFGREKLVLDHFKEINRSFTKVGIQAQIFSGIIPPMMNVVNNLSFAIVTGAGGLMAVKGVVTVGVIASFLNYSKQFARPISEIANQFNMIQSGLAGAERVFEVINEISETSEQSDGELLPDLTGEVVFENVSFGYEKDLPVLKNISLKASKGKTIALVGPTGAGKTTIINLLTRFYDIDQGAILVDRKDIRTVHKDSLRSALGIVLQDTYLFSDTVRENIRYGCLTATDEEVEAAARLANADLFIQRLPLGYDTVLTEDGGNLSQGQRQLLTIARAILADPAILILDEATSSVDTRTEMQIQKAMLELMKGRTNFVIAHRLSTIREADEILVINGGEITERGNHNQLISQKGFYYNLYQSQFNSFSQFPINF